MLTRLSLRLMAGIAGAAMCAVLAVCPGSQARDLWASTRATPTAVWSTPVNLGSGVNGPFNDSLAALSPDGSTLVFTSDRADGFGFGGSDLYITWRSRK